MTARRDVGETLIEVLLTIVIIGVTVTALLSSLAAAGNAGNLQRSGAQGDYVLRNYATLVKTKAQQCTVGAQFSAAYSGALPPGFSVSTIPAGTVCPDVAATLPALPYLSLTLTVNGPLGYHDSLNVVVRTP